LEQEGPEERGQFGGHFPVLFLEQFAENALRCQAKSAQMIRR
jgi:hypothetical protein